MKSAWKVQANPIGGDMQYGVYRNLDTSKTIHSGNMEHRGGYTSDREQAQRLVDKLNAEEDTDD